MKILLALLSVGLSLFLGANAADETGPSIRRIQLPDHGALDLPAPPAWRVEANRPLAFLPPTISFSPAEGDAFSVLITVLWNNSNDPKFNDPKSVAKLVAKARDHAVESATTRHISILELKGERLFGYYFSAIDRGLKPGEVKPGEWRYITQGSAALDDLLLTFTIFSNDPNQPEAASTLAMLQKAQRVPQ